MTRVQSRRTGSVGVVGSDSAGLANSAARRHSATRRSCAKPSCALAYLFKAELAMTGNSRQAGWEPTIEHRPCLRTLCHAREREHPEYHDAIRLAAFRRFRRLPGLRRRFVVSPRLDPRLRGDDMLFRGVAQAIALCNPVRFTNRICDGGSQVGARAPEPEQTSNRVRHLFLGKDAILSHRNRRRSANLRG